MAAGQLVLEITETTFMQDPENTLPLLQQFRELGYGMAMDDFGTGFSSFGQLRKMPVSSLRYPPSLRSPWRAADARRRLGQARAYDDPAWRREWGKRLVLLKLRSQQQFLERAAEVRGDARLALRKAIRSVRETRLGLAKLPKPTAQTLLGIEGGAAQAYFSGLAAILPPSLGFSGRNRRPPRDPFNALLSLGYTLLHDEAVKAVWMAGLDPYLGFYHQPAYGRESLASDMIEPLRTQVDRLCWDLCREQRITARHFTRDGEACLLSKAGRRHFIRRMKTVYNPRGGPCAEPP